MNERCHTNSVPWMFAIGLNKSGSTESTNCVHSWYGVGVTAFIHATVLVWPRSFMVRSWCDRGHSWYGADVTASIHGTELVWFRKVIPRGSCVHCTVEIYLADFFLLYLSSMTKKSIKISYIRTQPWSKTGGNHACKKTTKLYGGQLYGRSADSSPLIRWLVHGVLWGGRPLAGALHKIHFTELM